MCPAPKRPSLVALPITIQLLTSSAMTRPGSHVLVLSRDAKVNPSMHVEVAIDMPASVLGIAGFDFPPGCD